MTNRHCLRSRPVGEREGDATATSRRARIALAAAMVAVLVAVVGVVSWGDRHGGDGTARAATPAATTTTAVPAPGDGDAGSTPPDPNRPLRSFTFAATGDFLLHMPVQRKAMQYAGGSGYSFAPMLTETEPIISGVDLAICHMETPVSEDDTALTGYPVFNVPHEIAADAKAAGLEHAGTARSALEAVTPTIYDVHGVKVGHLSYAYGTNGIPIPSSQPWEINIIDVDKILADAAATKRAGADFVAVSLHWGNEYQSAPTAEQQTIARQLLASPDVDFIIGSHVHVVQPIERIGDKYVAYGVGNFLSNQGAPNTPTPSQDGMILQVAVNEQPDGSFQATKVDYTPIWVDHPSYHVTLATPQSNKASYDRTVAAVTALGPAAYQGEPIFTPITASAPG
jgi:Bacterial capsule synthesis protein PGA_cap